MPRGNDSSAAAADLRGQYGVEGNAEDLIRVHRLSYPQELRAAGHLGRNEEATAELDQEAVAKKVDGTLLDAAVRGNYVIAVVESEATGRTFKEAFPAKDFGLKVKEQGQRKAELDEAEQAEREQVLDDLRKREAAAKAVAEAEQKAEEQRAKAVEAAVKKAEKDESK